MSAEVPAAPLPPPPGGSVETAAPAASEAAPGFDWTSWDGTFDALPESDRDRYKPMFDHFDGKFRTLSEEAERNRETFNRYMQGLGDDPRLGELEAAKAQIAEELGLTKAEVERLSKEHSGLKAEYDKFREDVAQAEVEDFLEAHAAQAKDPAWFPAVLEAMKAGWDLEDAAAFAALPKPAQDIARAAMERGAPGDMALEYAQMKVPASTPKPAQPDAVEVVAGATTARVSGSPNLSFRGMSREAAFDQLLRRNAG